ncbi:MAG: hypothetical protein K2N72_08080 [Oscillospiraceae bacterium]|nr:hypothetical protein [Oscillospiraceae bacterium]
MKTAKKSAAIILSAMAALSAVTVLSAGANAEWVETDEGFCYIDNSTGKKLTGWQTIGSDEYYFDGKWHALGKRKYYFDENGVALTGWQEIDGNTYFFNGEKKGQMVTSWVNSANGRYYFGEDGVMRRGWKLLGEDIYFFGDNGMMRTGEQTIGDDVYTFDEEGRLLDPAPGDISLNHILQGISFGMTKGEVKENSILDLYERYNDSLVFTSVLSEYNEYLHFDDDGRLEKIVIFYPESDLEKLFTDAGWQFSDDFFIENPHGYIWYDLYLPEDRSFGAIVDYNPAVDYNIDNPSKDYTGITISSCDKIESEWRHMYSEYKYNEPREPLDQIFTVS